MTRIFVILFSLAFKSAISQISYQMVTSNRKCNNGLVLCDSIHKNSRMYSELTLDTINRTCELNFYYHVPSISHLSYLNTNYKGSIKIDNIGMYEIILDSVLYNEWRNFGWIDKSENQNYVSCNTIILVMKYKARSERILIKKGRTILKYKKIQ